MAILKHLKKNSSRYLSYYKLLCKYYSTNLGQVHDIYCRSGGYKMSTNQIKMIQDFFLWERVLSLNKIVNKDYKIIT